LRRRPPAIAAAPLRALLLTLLARTAALRLRSAVGIAAFAPGLLPALL
jgi:hypothetical protein